MFRAYVAFHASVVSFYAREAEVSNTPGVRRSRRPRVAPLKWWKGDNIQYGVDEAGLLVAEGIVKGRSIAPPARQERGPTENGFTLVGFSLMV